MQRLGAFERRSETRYDCEPRYAEARWLEGVPDLQASLAAVQEHNQVLAEQLSEARAGLAEARAFQQSAESAYRIARTDRERDLAMLDQAQKEAKQLAADLLTCRVQAQSQQIALDAAVREQALVREMARESKSREPSKKEPTRQTRKTPEDVPPR